MSQGYYKLLEEIGEHLIKAFGGFIQIARVHMDNNPLLMDAAEKFISILKDAARKEEEVSIVLSDGRAQFSEQQSLRTSG